VSRLSVERRRRQSRKTESVAPIRAFLHLGGPEEVLESAFGAKKF
jgi:hypothetical protein